MRGRGIGRFFPGVAALAAYDPGWLRYDLLAGLSVAAVAVPIAIAYSQLAGVPPVYGLYASILPLVAYAFLGTSRQLIMAPDAATCAIIAAVVGPLAGGDPERTISLTLTLAMVTGVVCIAADAGGMSTMDSTGAASLSDVHAELAAQGVGLAIADAHGPLRDMLRRSGLDQQIGIEFQFPTLADAVARLAGAAKGGDTRTGAPA